MISKESPETIKDNLSKFIGTEQYFVHSPFISYTDGVHYLAESTGSFWLIDIINSYQITRKISQIPFQLWILSKDKQGWKVTGDDGNDNIFVTQRIPFTDFPLDEIKLYLTNGILLLPSEY